MFQLNSSTESYFGESEKRVYKKRKSDNENKK